MAKRYFIKTKFLEPGMQIDQAVNNRLDQLLVQSGTILDKSDIASIERLGLPGVYILDEGAVAQPRNKQAVTPTIQAEKNIEQYRVADPRKVTLSNIVKERVSQGIQFLYNNTESKEFVETSANITSDLMKAIFENHSLAIDISALKTSDEYTFKHSVDVATLAMIIAKRLGMSSREVYDIGIAGLLHDMGKAQIPNEILNKPGRLTDDEFQVMKSHSRLGYNILKKRNEFPPMIPVAVLQHHEKMNGTGYPLKCKADKIVPFAKILSVADVYDALVTERPYKKAFSQRTAVEMIMSMTDQLDIDSMRSFLDTVILYPVDSNVRLSNGETARVVENKPGVVLRPTVVGLESGKVYNLADDLSCASILIL